MIGGQKAIPAVLSNRDWKPIAQGHEGACDGLAAGVERRDEAKSMEAIVGIC